MVVSCGVIFVLEVIDWRFLDINDSYFVVVFDGVFEGLELQDVCDLLWEVESDDFLRLLLFFVCLLYFLVDCIINIVFERGSVDNMVVVVVLLRLMDFFKIFLNNKCFENGDIDCILSRLEKFVDREIGNDYF